MAFQYCAKGLTMGYQTLDLDTVLKKNNISLKAASRRWESSLFYSFHVLPASCNMFFQPVAIAQRWL
jgi:hypothetical protein